MDSFLRKFDKSLEGFALPLIWLMYVCIGTKWLNITVCKLNLVFY